MAFFFPAISVVADVKVLAMTQCIILRRIVYHAEFYVILVHAM